MAMKTLNRKIQSGVFITNFRNRACSHPKVGENQAARKQHQNRSDILQKTSNLFAVITVPHRVEIPRTYQRKKVRLFLSSNPAPTAVFSQKWGIYQTASQNAVQTILGHSRRSVLTSLPFPCHQTGLMVSRLSVSFLGQ